jgi:hypothetical protein
MGLAEAMGDQEWEMAGGTLVDEFKRRLSGKSPYLGSLPWSVSFEVHEERVDGRWVTALREEDGAELVCLTDDFRCPTLQALFRRVELLLDIEAPDWIRSAREMRQRLADAGYRLVTHGTGRTLGHVSSHVIMADGISQLDAALQLRSDPEAIYDLLDAGADPMRPHVKFGVPYTVAMALAGTRPEYWEVVFYMRAWGAH